MKGSEGATARIPSLDGWRAIAIAMVLFSHGAFSPSQAGAGWVYWSAHTPFRGDMGVKIFFVLSGFLITRLLLNEETRVGRIHLGRFYARRALRIWPVYFACLAVIAILNLWQHWGMGWRHFAPSLTFTTGLWARSDNVWVTSHFWSLAVEQQFYLLWPVALRCCPAARRAGLVIGLLIVLPLARMALAAWWSFPLGWAFVTHFDFLLCGALAALLWPRFAAHSARESRWGVGALGGALSLLAFGAVEHAHRLGFSDLQRNLLAVGPGVTLLAVGLTLLIGPTVLQPRTRFGRVLNHRLLVGLGCISYSVYIWQQLILNPDLANSAAWQRFPLNIAVAVAVGILSYFAFERWFLRLKARFIPSPLQSPTIAPPLEPLSR